MTFWYLNVAAFIAAMGAVIHGYVYGRIYLGHINGSDLEGLTKSLSLIAWQGFTIWLAVSAGVLVCVSLDASLGFMAYPIIAVNVLCALLFVYLGLTGHGQLLKLPGAYVTGAIAGLAYLGVG